MLRKRNLTKIGSHILSFTNRTLYKFPKRIKNISYSMKNTLLLKVALPVMYAEFKGIKTKNPGQNPLDINSPDKKPPSQKPPEQIL